MPTPVWQPGTIYAPGAIVQPASTPAPQPDPLDNPGFEEGNTGWSLDSGFSIGEFGNGTHFQGTWSLQWDLTGAGRAINAEATEVVPGQTINGSCQVQQGASSSGQAGARCEILWYDASDEFLSSSTGNLVDSTSNQNWKQSSVTAVAPAGAAFARFAVYAFRVSGGDELWVDNCTWDAMVSTLPTGLVFKAVQATAGYSASSEPTWPLVNGQTVVDNEVTWEAVYASRVVWEATPVLVSGEYEPEWPTIPGGEVADGTIRWVAMNWRVTDAKCPQTPIVAIGASKIFCFDDDIIAYSATTNALDWSSEEDAGFLPFGLQTYGSNPGRALGLYRSNLLAFNAEGYQMWQIDEDPASMAFLDASPVPCTFAKGGQAVSNDYALVTPVGIRSIGIAGASTNLQAGYFGAQIDPLVLEKLLAGEEPITLTWPAAGQFWAIFEDEVFVLTMNGGPKDWSWSRYTFPYAITDWCILEDDLYLRAGNLIWVMDPEALADDVVCSPAAPVLSGELDELSAVLTWTAAEETVGPVASYRVYNATTAGLITEVDALTYTQTGLEVSTDYSYYVTAVGTNGGESDPSNTVTLTTVTPAAPALSGVVEDIGGGEFTNALSWTASTPAYAVTGYRLYNADDDSLIVQQAGITYDDTPIGLGVVKSYYVRAYGPGGGMSAPSNIVTLDTGDTATITEVFTTSGTWTKNANLIDADVYAIAAGGGGGSGRLTFPDSAGGRGGGGGEYRSGNFLAAALAATETITVGAGGAGAPAKTSSGTGTAGTDGGDSSFGSHLIAKGGKGGRGGGQSSGGSGAGGTGGTGGTGEDGGDGGLPNTPSSPPPAGTRSDPGGDTTASGPGGGGGGSRTNAGGTLGGNGGSSATNAGGTGGDLGTSLIPPTDGTVGESTTDNDAGGGGGGGGGSGTGFGNGSRVGADGADGGTYGAGGGGGGAGWQTTSGAGGDGADGVVVVVSHIAV